MALLDDIASVLQAAGVGTPGVDLFLGMMPDAPDRATAIYEYAGEPPEFDHDELSPAIRRMRIQVMCRDPDYEAARTQADATFNALCAIANRAINGTRYLRIEPLQSTPFSLSRDQSNRVRIVCNYRITSAE